MFRKPRENRTLPTTSHLAPSTGRAPSPPRSPSAARETMPAKATPKKSTAKPKTASSKGKIDVKQTTLVPTDWAKKAAANNARQKPKATPNGNILTFFKKAEELNSRIFLPGRTADTSIVIGDDGEVAGGWSDETQNSIVETDGSAERYNENGGSIKKRKLSNENLVPACSPSPPDVNDVAAKAPPVEAVRENPQPRKKSGPFADDSDSEEEDEVSFTIRGTVNKQETIEDDKDSKPFEEPASTDSPAPPAAHVPALFKPEETSQIGAEDFDEFEGLDDEDLLEGEEFDERRWMQEQQRLEMAEAGFEGDPDDFDPPSLFPEDTADTISDNKAGDAPSCPLCSAHLAGLSEQEVSQHVNACLDGNPIPLPKPIEPARETTPTVTNSKVFKRPPRLAKPGQQNPFLLEETNGAPKSAFSKLMSGHAEDAAWASAADAEKAARGKLSYQRTCPFYKILPGLYICVDAFRYGAVKGQNAYFLSHFHSDHYIGLTASWSHGPIYCSKVTGNLVRQQLRVDPKWVVDLDFEKKTEVPGTQGVHVTMISANHCPGSSLFLFEKEIGKGKNSKLQRVLHCGDFRACQAHLEHPLLRPDVVDAVSGKNRQQKLDVCYLDTTYLNPKYAFPPQQQVIQACADMCVSLNKEKLDESDGWEKMKKERAGEGMVKFIQKATEAGVEADSDEPTETSPAKIGVNKPRGKLLVVVGTYSIGKERICIGIAKALGSKIYAPAAKQRICRALEDPELDALLTSNPREAQVHMTPLFEIRAETLDDYLRDYSDCFCRAVGFRPSGWNYRPPKGRFTESPSVNTVLYSQNWKSQFSMRDLTQHRGSTNRAKCFGVPYSEHSSFRELSMFCCAMRIDKIIPTVNVGSAKSREKMKGWCEKWAIEKKKNGLFKLGEDGSGW
ncbi:DNA cross-link repair protein pso2/snm1 [Bimuria novae-zelandiae CBS 107.79]|uniref:DNA cross-link repair protein pso2/snm1 n=1 Tax=Bimuria novae-zelandiae CBS 107.79 TaxID=1447943 RepID=A0A6A5UVD3_9PLEO|nr:DNA cross-link repair protein pso2/snm1 [Bimuria novae-zelandiae CBS 107.79]